MYHSRSGTEVEGNSVQVGGVACGRTLPEARLWKEHSLHRIPLSVEEEWYCSRVVMVTWWSVALSRYYY